MKLFDPRDTYLAACEPVLKVDFANAKFVFQTFHSIAKLIDDLQIDLV